jgi:ribosomal protein L30/L7E
MHDNRCAGEITCRKGLHMPRCLIPTGPEDEALPGGHLGYAICRRRRPEGAGGLVGMLAQVQLCSRAACICGSAASRHQHIEHGPAPAGRIRGTAEEPERPRTTTLGLGRCNQRSFVSLLKAVRDMPRACAKRLLFKMEGMPHQPPLER